jgi:Na+/H+-dicarboxylate symporter
MKKMYKINKMGLLPFILVAIVLGIVCGMFFPKWLAQVFVTFNGLFSQFLGFIIPLLIFGLVSPAISNIGSKAGKMLLITVIIAYGNTLLSGFYAYSISDVFFPSMVEKYNFDSSAEGNVLSPFFTIAIPPIMGVMSALVLSFVMGLVLAHYPNSMLKQVLDDFQLVIVKVIEKVIIPLLPIYIYGIFLEMSFNGTVYHILSVFAKIIGVIFLAHVVLLILQYVVAGLVVKKNPLKLLATMLPAYFTALGTQSSAATIPVSLVQTVKNGVKKEIADFVIPLCATIHLSGSTMKIVMCALALMLVQGIPYNFGLFAGFICMLGVTMVAAPGVPGGAIMAALAVLNSILGFDENMQALMIALYIAMDSFGTACNVTGDGAIALVVNKILGKKSED